MPRVIYDEPAEGVWNMAVDEALLESAATRGAATMRLYQWSHPTLSLGYFQSLADRLSHESSRGCDVVRRATGGGAILHDRELTYSFTAPLDDRFAAQATSLYALLHETLIAALADWGVAAEIFGQRAADSSSKDEPPPFLCFQRRAEFDVVCGPAKVAGSAQRRRKGGVLQHGSVLLEASSEAPEIAGLAEVTGREVNAGKLAMRWMAHLGGRMQTDFRHAALTADERDEAKRLAERKYGSDHWTRRR